jgi:Ca2+-binding RTX toxin-like protein
MRLERMGGSNRLALLKAEAKFDFNAFNLNFYVKHKVDSAFSNGRKLAFAGQVYTDVLRVSAAEGPQEKVLTLMGPVISVDAGRGIDGGAVTALLERSLDTFKGYALTNFAVAGNVVRKSMETVSLRDDASLLESILDDSDAMSLSRFADVAQGFGGHDRIDGHGGADTLYGGEGKDTLLGGSGKDRLYGNYGDDLIIGGAGADRLRGGNGSDKFIYDKPSDGGDRIEKFGVDDFIAVKGAAFGHLPKGRLDPFRFVVSEGVHAISEKDRFIFNFLDGKLWYDPNGTGKGDRSLVADLDIPFLLTPDDIFVI